MTPDEIKASIRDAVNSMVKAEPEDQEAASKLIRDVIRQKAAALVNPQPEVDLTDVTPPADDADPTPEPKDE